jgi:2-dehydro-3-deoxygluconokinase
MRGARITFDTNFRARGWPDPDVARAVFGEAFAASDIVLASTEDLLPLYPEESDEQLMERMPCNEVVLKLLQPGSLVRFEGVSQPVSAEPVIRPVVDTTAAGDSFSAAYIAARLAGTEPAEAARAGHRLGGVVVGYPGAIIPRTAMPTNMPAYPPSSRKASQ